MQVILGIDPSGAYNDGGKGTTGWCLILAETKKVLDIGSVAAGDYPTVMQYWAAVVDVIKYARGRYHQELTVVLEDYVLYASKATAQINSHMETCQLIGILKYYMFLNGVEYRMQMAQQVVTRWGDDILVAKKYLVNDMFDGMFFKPNAHEKDAFRHALHFATFNGNPPEETEVKDNGVSGSDPKALRCGTRSSSGFIPRGFCFTEEAGPGSK